MSQPNPGRILLTGLLVGFLDITVASVQYLIRTGKGPAGVLKFVASGLFGKAALTGGNEMIVAGLTIHFLIAISFTMLFFILAKSIVFFRVNRFVTGLLYGAFVWFVMNILVWPLIKVPPRAPDLQRDLTAIGILIVCIGLPLAFLAIPKQRSNVMS